MIRLDTATRKLTAVSSGSGADIHYAACYSDKTTAAYVGGARTVISAGAASADVVLSPAAGAIRDVDMVSARNVSVGAVTVTIYFFDAGTLYQLAGVTLAAGSTLSYTHAHGWAVIDSAGRALTTVAGSASLPDVSAASRLLGRGSAAGAGPYQEISLGAGLSMTGTVLSTIGASGTDIFATVGAAQTLYPGTDNFINFDTEKRDTLSEFNPSTHVWLPTASGLYLISVSVYGVGVAGQARLACRLWDGTLGGSVRLWNEGTTYMAQASFLFDCVAAHSYSITANPIDQQANLSADAPGVNTYLYIRRQP